ncbi:putative quinol monooxygenase [Chitinophaga sp. Cy-1792]|uniref:putative quinol monooxygenase n=1 Tax=Chitinophaga sp. Cy-1792 TaxID=2608339 RepID=UPI001423B3C5|nr:putative quinol monooxygenase [Chitinophaga sp. Cy-1792]NIG55982.1 antibiotic biosynthesis monooxygenase [Chitinophaga sp. Cy-1792]
MKIYLTAIIKSKPEFREEVLAQLQEMVVSTRKEAACLQYDLHQGITDENLFVFYEIWQDEAGLALHNEQPYIKAFGAMAADKLAATPEILLTKLL